MNKQTFYLTHLFMVIVIVFVCVSPVSSGSGYGLGVRAGWSSGPSEFIIGAQGEFGRVLQTARFVPSVDFTLGDNKVTAINADFRWYLFPLPETGMYIYGAAGPTLILASAGKGNTNSDVGLSLTAGLKIPMKGSNRYNLEARFGFGDVPDFKLIFAVLFGI